MKNSIFQRCGWFVLCLLPWLIILTVPSWRSILASQMTPPTFAPSRIIETLASIPPGARNVLYPRNSPFTSQMPFARMVTQQLVGDPAQVDAFFLDATRRQPDQVWMLATWLAIQERAIYNRSLKVYKADDRKVDRRALLQAIKTAMIATEREPDNAYFYWMLATALLMDHREFESVAMLHTASTMAYYDDHWREYVRALNSFSESANGGRLTTLEESLQLPVENCYQQHLLTSYINAGASQSEPGWWLFTQLQNSSFTNRNRRLPLQIQGDLIVLAGRRCERMPGDWWLRQALRGLTRGPTAGELSRIPASPSWEYEKGMVRLKAQIFCEQTLAQGRPDLVRIANHAVEQCTRWPEPVVGSVLTPTQRVRIRSFEAAQNNLCQVAFRTARFLLCLMVLIFPWGMAPATIRRRDVLISSLSSTAAVFFYAICILGWHCTFGGEISASAVMPVFAPRSVSPAAVITARLRYHMLTRAWAFVLAPYVWAGVMVALATLLRKNRPDQPPEFGGSPFKRFFGPAAVPMWFRVIAWALLFGALQLLMLACLAAVLNLPGMWGSKLQQTLDPILHWTCWPVLSTTAYQSFIPAVLGFYVLIGYILWQFVYWRWLIPSSQRSAYHYALQWYRRTLMVSIGVCGFLYLLIMIVAIPCRNSAQRQIDDLLATSSPPAVQRDR